MIRAAILEAARSGPVLTVDLADRLGVPHVDVVGEVRRMKREGLVRARPWRPTTPSDRLALVAYRAAGTHPALMVYAAADGGTP